MGNTKLQKKELEKKEKEKKEKEKETDNTKNISDKNLQKSNVKEKVFKIFNKGTGAGGSNTNKNGLPYEELTDLTDKQNIIKMETKSSKPIEQNLKTDITPSKDQTKNWRKEQPWYHSGKSNECEIYQRNKVSKIIGKEIEKTNHRFNKETNTFEYMPHPNKERGGFEYTEDMDGVFSKQDITYYANFKMVCDKGGAQTRTLREVYDFITAQLNWLLQNKEKAIEFINILDGDESFRNRDKFDYLITKEKYKSIKDKVFIGDLYEFERFMTDPV